MSNVTTTKQAVRELEAAADRATTRHVVVDIQPGQMWCQGDIGILRLTDRPGTWVERERPPDGQVAPGTGTGSHHCVTGDTHRWFHFAGDALSDIGLVATDEWTMTHPRHGWSTCPPGTYQFIQQQDASGRRVLE